MANWYTPYLNMLFPQGFGSGFGNVQPQQQQGGMNLWGLLNPLATASFQGRPLFPGATANQPRNAQGFRTNVFGQPYGTSNLPSTSATAPITDPIAALTADLANETDPVRRAALRNFLAGGSAPVRGNYAKPAPVRAPTPRPGPPAATTLPRSIGQGFGQPGAGFDRANIGKYRMA